MAISDLLPDDLRGWMKSGPDRTFDRDTIFDYIDGGGEVYLTYGFRELSVRSFAKQAKPGITAEIFDMGSQADAFGIFSFEREGESVDIGEDSEYQAGTLRFWKGKYFTIISSESPDSATEEAILDLGRKISERIRETETKLPLIHFLPQEGMIGNQIRYFHMWFNLNYHFFIAENNILNLDENTHAVLAPYQSGNARCHLLLVSYDNEAKAREAYKTFLDAYMPESAETGIAMTENKKWTSARSFKNYVIVVFDAPSKEAAFELLERVQDSKAMRETGISTQ